MKASELIAKLQDMTKDGDREVEFFSWEWTEDLEEKNISGGSLRRQRNKMARSAFCWTANC